MSPDARTGVVAPFLRWAGSKRWLLPTLEEFIPATFGSYYEPFLGSGAAFFAFAEGHRAILADSIPELIDCFAHVRDDAHAIAEILTDWAIDSETYYTIRAEDGQSGNVRDAARFIYLNKLCFNGLYRVNQRGKFNVPYGRPKSANLIDETELYRAAALLGRAKLMVGDFAVTLETAGPGDLVYLDPPYVAGHRNNGFVDYNAKVFDWADQVRLAKEFERLDSLGAYVVQSNANHESIRALYPDREIHAVSRFSSMAGRSASRGTSGELVIIGDALRRTLDG